MSSERRELYRSPNGDSWFLAREPTDGRAFIIHQPNSPSGGRLPTRSVSFDARNAEVILKNEGGLPNVLRGLWHFDQLLG
jgi:hypothetical protein